MNPISGTVYRFVLFFSLFLMIPPNGMAASESPDKTLSPYFLVRSDDPAADLLPLTGTSARVRIAGVIADVRVTQEYQNRGARPIEAIYVFPASTKAAVCGMKMTIGERTIVADIREREKARQEYEAAKAEGKSASLLEQQRPNVFQMNVANIMPGDRIVAELRYTELLVPTDGEYEFVYPTVVGPRYAGAPESGSPAPEKWVENPYLHEGEKPAYTFDITAEISAGMPIDSAVCPSHKTDIRFDSPALARVTLDPSETYGGNRDFILRYRLTGGQVQSGLLLCRGETENFFLLMMQPPERIAPAQMPPREYIFIVDVSGSMRGFPLDTSKTLMKNLIGHLRPADRFNVLLFAGGSKLLSERSLPATPENIARAIQVIDDQRGGGGTEVLPALKRALDLPGDDTGSRSVVIVTDGFVRVEKEAFDLIRTRLGEANIFTFGIGSSVNRHLIEGMARAGMGEPFVITGPEEAPDRAAQFRRYIESPVLTGVSVRFDGFDVYDTEPPAIPDLFARRPIIVFGKWKGEPDGTVRLRGLSGGAPYSADLAVSRFRPEAVNAGLRYLWARHRIAMLTDDNRLDPGEREAEKITRLGLTYNLLTQYTSFVAIDSQVRNTDGKTTTVVQPLPLPQGVSDSAVSHSRSPVGGIMYSAAPKMAMPLTAPVMAPPPQPEMDRKSADSDADTAPADEAKPVVASVLVVNDADKMTVRGMLPRAHLREVLEQHLEEIKRCIRLLPETEKHRKSEMVLKVTIGPGGQVTAAEVISGDLKDEVVRLCIRKKIREWSFHPSEDGKPVSAEYHIRFFKGMS
ncbi:trypsin [Desulfonema ishimotonii]|uniref:Trypsin n=1 Tax=Desulfonema ishimotonii TaxID=45657 RepID=A0A401G275_9BACT|nr:VIT domain-containing protein [Desulfonema ishimotonii]GBC63314.1 trypsin [Desulfonema ishimotonii]